MRKIRTITSLYFAILNLNIFNCEMMYHNLDFFSFSLNYVLILQVVIVRYFSRFQAPGRSAWPRSMRSAGSWWRLVGTETLPRGLCWGSFSPACKASWTACATILTKRAATSRTRTDTFPWARRVYECAKKQTNVVSMPMNKHDHACHIHRRSSRSGEILHVVEFALQMNWSSHF